MNFETLNKNLDEIFELLTKSELEKTTTKKQWIRDSAKGGRFAIITPDKPLLKDKKMDHVQFRNHLNQLRDQGQIKSWFHARGQYEDPNIFEGSYVVVEPKDFEQMRDLGARAGQDSVLLSENNKHQIVRTNRAGTETPTNNGKTETEGKEIKPDIGFGYTGEGPVTPQPEKSFEPFSTRIKSKKHKAVQLSLNTNYGDENAIQPAMKSEGSSSLGRLLCAMKKQKEKLVA